MRLYESEVEEMRPRVMYRMETKGCRPWELPVGRHDSDFEVQVDDGAAPADVCVEQLHGPAELHCPAEQLDCCEPDSICSVVPSHGPDLRGLSAGVRPEEPDLYSTIAHLHSAIGNLQAENRQLRATSRHLTKLYDRLTSGS